MVFHPRLIPLPQGDLPRLGPDEDRHGELHHPEPEASPPAAGRAVREGQIPADSGQAAR